MEDYKNALTTNPVTSVYAALGKLKAEEPALTWGEFKELHLTTQCYAYARVLDGEALVAVLNNGDSPAQLEFQLPVEANAAEDLLADTVGAQPVMTSFDWGRMKVQLPSNYATILRLKSKRLAHCGRFCYNRGSNVGKRKGSLTKMNAAQRRECILTRLSGAQNPVSASALAAELGVSRQIVVGDVALLRAGGAQIDATPRGYQLHPAEKGYTGILACVHRTEDEMRRELYTIVDQGGVAVDVAVENSLYGEIRANLNLASRYDVDTFLVQARSAPESLLSRMTGGVHLHTLRCPDRASFERIRAELDRQGLLYRRE